MNILEISNLTKTYKTGTISVDVLNGLSLNIAEGEIVIIMGQSGVGKSTLLNIMGALDKPTSGNLRINDEDVLSYNEKKLAKFRNQHVGFIFQFHHLLTEFTALENVLMPGMIKGKTTSDDNDRAKQLLADVGLAERLHHRPNELSGGEQQRVAVARALMNQPKLILADEPTGDLDRKNSQMLFDLIVDLNGKYNQTFIIVTHDELIAEQAHRIIYLEDGKVSHEKRI